VRISLRINGERHEADCWEGESLLFALREKLGFPGSKNACEQGECGSCSVLLDGTLVCACLVVGLPRSPRRLLGAVAVAAVLLLGVTAGGLVRGDSTHRANTAPRVVAVVASAETPDQLRRLRRTTLLNMRQLPRELTGDPV
jgi:hypothetical protein